MEIHYLIARLWDHYLRKSSSNTRTAGSEYYTLDPD